ncbi:MAG: hypothetical protein O2783_07090 [Chloroflexi bacterium]|nr:hypothetical protein [Chloroflexota bacterium]
METKPATGKQRGDGEERLSGPAAETMTVLALQERVQDLCRERPHLTSRIEKAGFIVLLRSIQELKYRRHYRVGAEDGLRTYDVINGHCECSDYVRHGPGHPCKHRLAIELYEEIGSTVPTSVHSQNETNGSSSSEGEMDDYI